MELEKCESCRFVNSEAYDVLKYQHTKKSTKFFQPDRIFLALTIKKEIIQGRYIAYVPNQKNVYYKCHSNAQYITYIYQIHWPQILTHNHIFPLLLIDVNNKRFSSIFLHKSRRNFRMDFRTQIVVVITVVQLVLVIQQIGYMNMIHWHCIRRCKVLLTMVKIPVWMRTRDLCQTYLFWKVSKLMVHSTIKICINYSLRHGFRIPVIWWFVECRKTLKLVTNNNSNNEVILTLTFPSTMSNPNKWIRSMNGICCSCAAKDMCRDIQTFWDRWKEHEKMHDAMHGMSI